jgi:hypothetical protein
VFAQEVPEGQRAIEHIGAYAQDTLNR